MLSFKKNQNTEIVLVGINLFFFHPSSENRNSAPVTTAHYQQNHHSNPSDSIWTLLALLTMNRSNTRNSAPDSKHVPWIRQSSDSASFQLYKWFSGNFSPILCNYSPPILGNGSLPFPDNVPGLFQNHIHLPYNNLLLGPSPSTLWIISRMPKNRITDKFPT